MRYQIVISSIGVVSQSNSASAAEQRYASWVEKSKEKFGRGAGETVTLWDGGEIFKEYKGLNTVSMYPGQND